MEQSSASSSENASPFSPHAGLDSTDSSVYGDSTIDHHRHAKQLQVRRFCLHNLRTMITKRRYGCCEIQYYSTQTLFIRSGSCLNFDVTIPGHQSCFHDQVMISSKHPVLPGDIPMVQHIFSHQFIKFTSETVGTEALAIQS